ncbi:MAG: hypothetical protein ACJ73S_23260 [Mycobacteriales bacterium]
MTIPPDELVRDGLRRIADQAAPVSGGGLAASVIAGAERRHRRTLATSAAAVVAVLVLGAAVAAGTTHRRDIVPAARVPFRDAVSSGPVAIGWYHMRGMKDDANWVLNPATGAYRLLRGETIMDISPDGRTALAYPFTDRYATHVDLVDLVTGKVTRRPLGHVLLNARWAPAGDRYVVTVTDAPVTPEPRRTGFVVGWTDGTAQQYVRLPGPAGGLPQELSWAGDSGGLWSWGRDTSLGAAGADGLPLTRYGLDGRAITAMTLDATRPSRPERQPPRPLVSPDDRYVVSLTANDTFMVSDLSGDNGVTGPLGSRYDTTPLSWYDDTHLVVQRSDLGRTRERVVVVGLDGRVTRVLVPWQPGSLRAEFHVYRRG